MLHSILIRYFFFFAVFMFPRAHGFAQCVPTGVALPASLANNTSVGSIGWSNLLNAISSNNSYASCGTLLGILGSAQTNYIQGWNYGLAIPATASVCGIEVRIERNAAGLLIGSSVRDQNVYLMKNGLAVGINHASSTNWSGSDAVAVYGSNSDLWGTTWTPAQVNASNFGVELSAQMNAGLASLFLTANVDAISITVYYTASTLPMELISFTGEPQQQTVKIQWQTASETNNRYFEVEKMNDAYDWELLERVSGKGNSYTLNSYMLYDHTPEALNYYRIKQIDHSGKSTYSSIISVAYTATAHTTSVYPVPAVEFLYIRSDEPIEKAEILSDKGESQEAVILLTDIPKINISVLTPGLYYIKIITRTKTIIHKFVKV